MRAEKKLLRRALEASPSAMRFVLLSESCVPLRSFAFVRAYLLDERGTGLARSFFYHQTLVPIRLRSRGERRSLRTLLYVSLRPGSLVVSVLDTPRRLSTTTDAL